MSFYENLERVCREKGTTPHTIAVKKLGKSPSTLAYWRNGGNTPTMKIIEELAEALGVKPSDLLRTEEDKMQEEKSAKAALFGSGTVVTDAQWDEVKNFAEYIKARDAKTAQHLLGHSQISTTLDIYTEFREQSVDAAASLLNRKLAT